MAEHPLTDNQANKLLGSHPHAPLEAAAAGNADRTTRGEQSVAEPSASCGSRAYAGFDGQHNVQRRTGSYSDATERSDLASYRTYPSNNRTHRSALNAHDWSARTYACPSIRPFHPSTLRFDADTRVCKSANRNLPQTTRHRAFDMRRRTRERDPGTSLSDRRVSRGECL